MVLWYRPEDSTEPRPAYAVDLTTGGSDLGGSVAAALASASVIFQSQNETEYAALLLDKAKGVRGGASGCRLFVCCAEAPPPVSSAATSCSL